MIEYLFDNPIEFWYFLGAIIMMAQMLLGGSIWLFSAAFAAFSIALSMRFELIALHNPIHQVAVFLVFSCFWSAILWKPMGYLMNLGKQKDDDNRKRDSIKLRNNN